jgi:hypothetical protein
MAHTPLPAGLPAPPDGQTWYDVLDVDRYATTESLDNALRHGLALVEGTRAGGYAAVPPAVAHRLRQELETAWLVLTDARLRAAYDAHLDATNAAVRKPPLRWSAPVTDDADVQKPEPLQRVAPRVRFAIPIDDVASLPPTTAPVLAAPVSTVPRTVSDVSISGEVNGQVVRRLREEQAMSLETLAEHTKIRIDVLKAIEANDVGALPARVYLRGFLTQIARVLHVDKDQLANGYLNFVERFGS